MDIEYILAEIKKLEQELEDLRAHIEILERELESLKQPEAL